MILLAGFFETLFRGFIFVGLALSVGGILFRVFVLNPSAAAKDSAAALGRNSTLIALGALVLAISQLLSLGVALASLADDEGRWQFSLFISTSSALAGLARSIVAVLIAAAALRSGKRAWSRSKQSWFLALGALALAIGAWLVHGADRLAERGVLMAITVLHQLAAVTWIGGVAHLAAQWHLLRRNAQDKGLWPELPARFSGLALSSTACLVVAGTFLSFRYVATVRGLMGTAYGTMLLSKTTLTTAALALGAVNFLSLRGAMRSSTGGAVYHRLPICVETEATIGMIILLAASSLTGQPPPIDTIAQQASPFEVAHVFAPKSMQLVPAPLAELNALGASVLDPFVKATALDRIQSNFNHNWSGIFVLVIGVAALLHAIRRSRLTRHWPMLFLPFWLFLVLFAQPTGWPLGRKGFWESLLSAEVLQHRMGTLLLVALGILEWRVQVGKSRSERSRKAFPLLCFLGGALLLTHSHSLQVDKSAFLIEVSHNAIGILAVLIGALSWLERRSSGQIARAAALLWPICFIGVGLVLMAYQEPVIAAQ